jgi:hypothetical protein
MRRVIVVGAGLFGSIAAAYARRRGFAVDVIDRREETAGSRAAACLMKPGWMSGLPKQDVANGLALLDELYGLQSVDFKLKLSVLEKRESIHWVHPSKMLLPNIVTIDANVKDLKHYSDSVEVVTEVGNTTVLRSADFVLLACGAWGNELFRDMPPIRSLVGMSYKYRGQLKDNIIQAWAPYKQTVAFNISDDVVWAGDGQAILKQNWKLKHIADSRERCADALAHNTEVGHIPRVFEQTFGERPYIKGYSGFFAQHGRVFVSNGGAKNGTIIAAIQAKRFVDTITRLG